MRDEYQRILANIFAIDSMCWQDAPSQDIVEWLWREVSSTNVYDVGELKYRYPGDLGIGIFELEARRANWNTAAEALNSNPADAVVNAMAAAFTAEVTQLSLEEQEDKRRAIRLAQKSVVDVLSRYYWKKHTIDSRGAQTVEHPLVPDFQLLPFRMEWSKSNPQKKLSEIIAARLGPEFGGGSTFPSQNPSAQLSSSGDDPTSQTHIDAEDHQAWLEAGDENEIFGRGDAKRRIKEMLESAVFDEDTGEILLPDPWDLRGRAERRYSSIDDLTSALEEVAEEEISSQTPYEGGEPVFDIDASDIVSDALADIGAHEFFEGLIEPEEAEESEEQQEEDSSQSRRRAIYHAAVGALCERFAKEIARDPDFLEQIEWRDLERLLADVLGKLGFKVTLTEPSKDGGKDLVLETSYEGAAYTYFIEVKHWRSGKKVGEASLRDFVSVVLREKVSAGIFVSSSGYTEGAYKALSMTEKRSLVLQGREKIYTLCKTYVLAEAGVWEPPANLAEVVLT